jgi:peptidoglycan/xylan/chitin deacetylase (PgdA/CDA1 family)
MSMRIVASLLALIVSAGVAAAAQCGPDKLGTARIQPVGRQGGLEVGLKTYPRTIPLADHEVILTFDDGPDAVNTPKILDALKAECVRATFFEIGRNAERLPAIARREVEDGHTVAHHTFSHPQPTLRFMSEAAARADILRGMIAVEKAAYGRDFSGVEPQAPKDLKLEAPFFRFPGFADTPDLKSWLAANDVGIFGVDLWASDWIKMTPEAELKLVMRRLDKNGHRGMLLLHDNHPWTAAMVPMLLKELKAKGYRVVHMVAGPGAGPTVPAPPGWTSETERVVGALKPRLEKSAARMAHGPIRAKPAPAQ